MLILGYDYETTGLDRRKDRIIEAGLVLYDTLRKQPVRLMSSFIYEPDYPEIDVAITAKTGITLDMLKQYGVPNARVMDVMLKLMSVAEVVMAFNGEEFDFLFTRAEASRQLKQIPEGVFWVDAMKDVPYPESITTRKLEYLAAAHGFLNPFSHRALFDVVTMFKVTDNYSYPEILSRSTWSFIVVQSKQQYQDNHQAKAFGFLWDGELKIWYKEVPEPYMDGESKNWPFPWQIINRKPGRNTPARLAELLKGLRIGEGGKKVQTESVSIPLSNGGNSGSVVGSVGGSGEKSPVEIVEET